MSVEDNEQQTAGMTAGPSQASPVATSDTGGQPAAAEAADDTKPSGSPPGPLASVSRRAGPLAARGSGVARPSSPVLEKPVADAAAQTSPKSDEVTSDVKTKHQGKPSRNQPKRSNGKGQASADDSTSSSSQSRPQSSRVAVPSKRAPLAADLQQELETELALADVESLLSGSAGMPDRPAGLVDGQRVHASVLKIHDDQVFVAMGGPDEGMVPFEQFETEPSSGDAVEVMVRGFSRSDGLYICSLPGQAVDVASLEDVEEGTLVEVTITAANSGGVECAVGGAPGFMPISQISEHRVEDAAEFVGQKMVCLVTECKPQRRRLIVSRRAVLEREREEKRKQQLEQLNAGDLLEGTVRSVKDFGAFVDLGGLDGMIHISKLSWDRIKHPSEVLEEGQKVKVKIDQINKQTGKISLSYRDLMANPWDSVEANFPVGQNIRGTVSRIATFGAFVKLAPGVEGLIHISELAHHRVSRVNNVVNEGDAVEVKVQSIDRDAQRIGLSLKAATAPVQAPAEQTEVSEESESDATRPVVKGGHSGPLKGGTDGSAGGEKFGLRW